VARMTGSRFFAETVHAYGISHLFFVPTILFPALAEMEDLGICRMMTHGEKAAAYMADGYARAARKPGLCLAQSVGAANLAAGLKDAYLAGSPVVAITGGPTHEYRYRHVYQEIEDFPMFEPVTKLNARVDTVERLPDLLRQAFRVATSGMPGPVHLQLRGHFGQSIEGEADLTVFAEEQYASYPPVRPEAEPERVRDAARLLAEAARPVIVAGGGVVASGAAAELVALAEKLSIPVATALNAKEVIAADHPLAIGVCGTYSRWCANRLLTEADLVFFIGSHTGSQVTDYWKYPPRGTPVLQLDVDPEEIGRSYPARVGLVGDARATLRRLLEAVEPTRRDDWTARARQVVAEWRAEQEPLRASDAVPMRPERICREIGEWLPPDAVVVSDTGHAGIWTGTMLDLTSPGQRYIRCAGSLGWGLPGAIGAKCALPDRPVLCFTGDGGLYYHLAELETAARFGINVVVVVNDNRSLNQETLHVQEAYGGNPRGGADGMWIFEPNDLARVAESLGCLGIRVERPSEIRPALERAFAANRPALIDAVSDIAALADRAHA